MKVRTDEQVCLRNFKGYGCDYRGPETSCNKTVARCMELMGRGYKFFVFGEGVKVEDHHVTGLEYAQRIRSLVARINDILYAAAHEGIEVEFDQNTNVATPGGMVKPLSAQIRKRL
jgi:hypothetical protein